MKNLLNMAALRSISARLTAMAVAGALFMVFVACTVLFIARAELAAERTEKAHAVVDAVWSMAESFQHAAESGAMTQDEAKARLFAASSAPASSCRLPRSLGAIPLNHSPAPMPINRTGSAIRMMSFFLPPGFFSGAASAEAASESSAGSEVLLEGLPLMMPTLPGKV